MLVDPLLVRYRGRMATDAHALPAVVRADRRALVAIAAGHMSSDLCQGAVPALLPFLISDRGLSYAGATALLLALTVSSSVIQPLLGHASDRMQGAWLMPAGVLVGGVGISLAGITGAYPATLAAVVVGGIGVAAFHPEGARYVPLVAGSGASTGMGLYSVGGNAGFVVGPIVVTAGVAAFGLRGTLLVAVIPALSALLLWSVRPRLVAAAASARAGGSAGTAAEADAWGAFTVLSAMVVARTAVGYGLLAFVPIWFVRELDASAGAGNAALTLLLAAGAAGTLMGGQLAVGSAPRMIVGGMAALFPLVALLPSPARRPRSGCAPRSASRSTPTSDHRRARPAPPASRPGAASGTCSASPSASAARWPRARRRRRPRTFSTVVYALAGTAPRRVACSRSSAAPSGSTEARRRPASAPGRAAPAGAGGRRPTRGARRPHARGGA